METALLATAVLTILAFVMKNAKTVSYAPVRIKADKPKHRR